MVNYKNGKIYKITSEQTMDVYYGSTCLTLKKRMSNHKSNYSRYIDPNNEFKEYCTSYELLKYTYSKIELIENFECATRQELQKREFYNIQNNDCINKIKGDFNKNQYNKEYYILNKDEITEYKKQYIIDNKDKLLEQQKQYYIDNKNKITEYKKQYYIDNKDKIIEHGKEKINCICSGKYTKGNRSNHFKSPKHQNFINSQI